MTTIAIATEQLARYGYTLNAGEIHRGDKPRGVLITVKGARFQARTRAGALLWSGPDVGHFVEKFWYAVKIQEGASL